MKIKQHFEWMQKEYEKFQKEKDPKNMGKVFLLERCVLSFMSSLNIKNKTEWLLRDKCEGLSRDLHVLENALIDVPFRKKRQCIFCKKFDKETRICEKTKEKFSIKEAYLERYCDDYKERY